MATAGAVPVCDCTGVARSTAPPSTPAVPTSIVRRNTERQRTVFSVIAFPPTFPGSNQPELRLIEATLQERQGTGIHLPPGTCRSRRCPRPSLVRPALERGVRLLQTVHRNDADAMRHES